MKQYFKPILLTGEVGLHVEDDDRTFGPEDDEGSVWGGQPIEENPLQP